MIGDNFITTPYFMDVSGDGQLCLKEIMQPSITGKEWNPVLVKKESRIKFYNKLQEEEKRGNDFIEVGLIYIDKKNGKIYFIERAED